MFYSKCFEGYSHTEPGFPGLPKLWYADVFLMTDGRRVFCGQGHHHAAEALEEAQRWIDANKQTKENQC